MKEIIETLNSASPGRVLVYALVTIVAMMLSVKLILGLVRIALQKPAAKKPIKKI